ncbi:hypothetical protein V2J09_003776 [Rumex salicifolius]
MSEDSSSRFGRHGPVIKSGRSPDSEPSCTSPVSGSKRSVKDRLGTRADDPFEEKIHENDKRLKGEHNQEIRHPNDTHLAKGDLRLEIMKMRDQSTGIDLRVKLSSKTNSASADGNRSRFPESSRQNVECKSYDDHQANFCRRKSMLETRDIDVDKRKNMEDSMPDLGGSSRGQYMWDFGDRVRVQSFREVRDFVGGQGRGELKDVVGRQSMGEHKDTHNIERPIMQEFRADCSGVRRQYIQEPWNTYNGGDPNMLDTRDGRLRPISFRMGSDLPAAGHPGTSHSSWALNIPRRRSPDKMLSSIIVRASSPDRNLELQRRETIRQYDDNKSLLYRSHVVPGPYTPAGLAIHVRRPPLNALPPLSSSPMPLPAHFPQPILRNQNPVDFHALMQMTDYDLKELTIPMLRIDT